MGAAENVECLLETAIVEQRAPIAGQQRLVVGVGDRGLFEHRNRLGALPRGSQRLAISQRRLGVLGIRTIALPIGIHLAADIGAAGRFGFIAQRPRDIGGSRGLAVGKSQQQDRERGSASQMSCEGVLGKQLSEHVP